MNSDNIWKVVIGAVLIYAVDSYAVNSLVDDFQAYEGYEQACAINTFSNGMVANGLMRKVEREITIEDHGLHKYLYIKRAVRKAMDQC